MHSPLRGRRAVLGTIAAAAALAVITSAAQAANITPPPNTASAGKIVYCSDITYPPEESYVGTKAVGSDIDIGTAIATLMGVKAVFQNTGFDGIIAALLSKKCDAVISGMNDTPARRKQVAFVDYIAVGQSLMVKHGNPDKINKLADLSGKSVSVETGTTNRDFLAASSKAFQKAGKKPIQIVTFPKDTDAAAALKAGKVNAYFGDSPVVAYYIAKGKGSFSFGGAPVNPILVGIAIRKGDPLVAATKKAVNTMYANGSMKKILAKWQMSAVALQGK